MRVSSSLLRPRRGFLFSRNLLPVAVILLLFPVFTAVKVNHTSSDTQSTVYLPLIHNRFDPNHVCVPLPNIPPDDLDQELKVADEINAERVKNGLSPLTLAPELTQAARKHSNDMADKDFFNHTGSDGSNAGQRIDLFCYDWSTWGEIIGCRSDGDPSQMVQMWMDSPSHRAIILDNNYVDLGVGYAYNPASSCTHYWTVDFAKRATFLTNSPGTN
jgi:uncharacterized protein YkwD